jgi:hypothetical protein
MSSGKPNRDSLTQRQINVSTQAGWALEGVVVSGAHAPVLDTDFLGRYWGTLPKEQQEH